MRGYRRRAPAADLAGVAAALVLVVVTGVALDGSAERPWWGLRTAPDGAVHRVDRDSPAAVAGIVKGDRVLSVDGVPVAHVWARTEVPGRPLEVRLESPDGSRRTALVIPSLPPPGRVRHEWVRGFMMIAFVATGLVVFLARSDGVSTLFFVMCLMFAGVMTPTLARASREAVFLEKVLLDVAQVFLPSVLLHFFLLFPRRVRLLSRRPRLAWLLYLPAVVAMPVAIGLDVTVVLEERPVPEAGAVFQSVTALLFVLMITAGVAIFVHGVRHVSSPPLRRGVRWVLPGIALGVLPPLLFAAVLNLVPDVEIPGEQFALVPLVLVPISFGHAILRYGLLDLELVVKRSAVWALLTALLVAVYWIAAEGVGRWIVERTGVGRTVLSFAVVFATALLFVPLRDRVQAFVDRRLDRHAHTFRSTVREFSRAFATFVERRELVDRLVDRLPQILEVERAALFLREGTDRSLCLAGTRGLDEADVPLPCFTPSRALRLWWREVGGPVPLEGRAGAEGVARLPGEEGELLAALAPSVLVFLPRGERTVEGLLVLGPKESGDRFRAHDLELLATLGEQAGTALASARLREEALERRRLEEELAVARRIQASLLPDRIPQRPGLEIAAFTRPSRHVGGDLYDLLEMGDGTLGLAVADVSGKGVPAALILSGLQATLRAEAPGAEDGPEPVVERINRRLCADVQPGSFASLLYGRLDPARRTLRYVNAGHPAGLVVRRDGTLERLDEGGILLGFEPEARFTGGARTFDPGDLLLFYSDGITDVLDPEDEEFGQARLEAMLPRLASLPVQDIVDRIVASVETFVGTGSAALPDDLTILVARFRPPLPADAPTA